MVLATPFQVYFSITSFLPRLPISSCNSLSLSIIIIASASFTLSLGGTINQPLTASKSSATPTISVVITGVWQAKASNATIPNPSCKEEVEGKTKTLA